MCSERSRPALVEMINLGWEGTYVIVFYFPALNEKIEQRMVPLSLILLRVLTTWPSMSTRRYPLSTLAQPSFQPYVQITYLTSISGMRQIGGPKLLLRKDAFPHLEQSFRGTPVYLWQDRSLERPLVKFSFLELIFLIFTLCLMFYFPSSIGDVKVRWQTGTVNHQIRLLRPSLKKKNCLMAINEHTMLGKLLFEIALTSWLRNVTSKVHRPFINLHQTLLLGLRTTQGTKQRKRMGTRSSTGAIKRF